MQLLGSIIVERAWPAAVILEILRLNISSYLDGRYFWILHNLSAVFSSESSRPMTLDDVHQIVPTLKAEALGWLWLSLNVSFSPPENEVHTRG
jgi:hypothetical protein